MFGRAPIGPRDHRPALVGGWALQLRQAWEMRPHTVAAANGKGVLVTAQGIVGADPDNQDQGIAVDVRVRVYPGTEDEASGLVVDDFGDAAGQSVDIGEHHICDPARRWAVLLDSGSLTFVDSDALTPE